MLEIRTNLQVLTYVVLLCHLYSNWLRLDGVAISLSVINIKGALNAYVSENNSLSQGLLNKTFLGALILLIPNVAMKLTNSEIHLKIRSVKSDTAHQKEHFAARYFSDIKESGQKNISKITRISDSFSRFS